MAVDIYSHYRRSKCRSFIVVERMNFVNTTSEHFKSIILFHPQNKHLNKVFLLSSFFRYGNKISNILNITCSRTGKYYSISLMSESALNNYISSLFVHVRGFLYSINFFSSSIYPKYLNAHKFKNKVLNILFSRIKYIPYRV